MKFGNCKLEGVYEIYPNIIHDNRGFFMRYYDQSKFKEKKIHRDWKQENHSKTLLKGTIRGLHFQFPPFSEAKLVRCIKGKILNVFVDLRKGSKTFGQWEGIELSEQNRKMLFIPRGFANGFCILEDDTELAYKTDNYYSPENEGSLSWNDRDLNIKWPISDPILSEKDKSNMTFKEFVNKFNYLPV